jgi:hypothetical protein
LSPPDSTPDESESSIAPGAKPLPFLIFRNAGKKAFPRNPDVSDPIYSPNPSLKFEIWFSRKNGARSKELAKKMPRAFCHTKGAIIDHRLRWVLGCARVADSAVLFRVLRD